MKVLKVSLRQEFSAVFNNVLITNINIQTGSTIQLHSITGIGKRPFKVISKIYLVDGHYLYRLSQNV